MSWHGDGIQHSLAKRGIRVNRISANTYDLRGLGKLVDDYVTGLGEAKDARGVTYSTVGFQKDAWELVVDTSSYREEGVVCTKSAGGSYRAPRRRSHRRMSTDVLSAAPKYVLGFDEKTDHAYVIIGRGGTFVHPAGYKDNHYQEPIAFSGQAVILPEPVTLFAAIKEADTGESGEVPFTIAGFVGLETKVANETAKVTATRMQTEGQMVGVA